MVGVLQLGLNVKNHRAVGRDLHRRRGNHRELDRAGGQLLGLGLERTVRSGGVTSFRVPQHELGWPADYS